MARQRRLRHEDYALQLFNIANKGLVSVRRVQDVDIGTDFRTELVTEVTNEGTVSYEVDVPVTSLSFGVNLVSENPTAKRNPLSWLAALAGLDSENGNLKRVFGIGDTLTYHPDGLKESLPVSDFDTGITRSSARVDGWLAVRDVKKRDNLGRVEALINGQVTSLDFGFSVGTLGTASVTIEADGISRMMSDLKGADIGCKFADSSDKTSITIDAYDRVLAVWLNWKEVHNWTATDGSTIVFDDTIGCGDFTLRSGDVIKYIYLPPIRKTWEDYQLKTASHIRAEIEKSQVDVRLVSNTGSNRVVEGFYPVRQYTEGSIVVSYTDGGSVTHDALLLKSGHAYIGGELYFTGFTPGEVDTGSDADTIIDLALADGRPNDYWKGCTITMLSGDTEGETVTIKSFNGTTGAFELESSLSAAPQVGDDFRINAIEVENGGGTHDTVYVSLNTTTSDAEVKTFPALSPPANGTLFANYDTGTDFTNYSDGAKCIIYSPLIRIQELSFSVALDREEVNELGSDQVVDRNLNKPIAVNTDLVAIDIDEEVYELLSGTSGKIDYADGFKTNLGLQVIVYRDKPEVSKNADESKQRVVYEVIDCTPVNVGNTASVGASGEVGIQLLCDNFRIINIE